MESCDSNETKINARCFGIGRHRGNCIRPVVRKTQTRTNRIFPPNKSHGKSPNTNVRRLRRRVEKTNNAFRSALLSYIFRIYLSVVCCLFWSLFWFFSRENGINLVFFFLEGFTKREHVDRYCNRSTATVRVHRDDQTTSVLCIFQATVYNYLEKKNVLE